MNESCYQLSGTAPARHQDFDRTGGGAIIAAPESKTRLFGLQKESPPAQVTKVRNDVLN